GVVGDLDASVPNGDAFESTSLEGRRLIAADAIHEFADEIDTGRLDGVAECARQAGSTLLRRHRHGAVTQTEPYALDGHAQTISAEHGHHGVGPAPDIGRAAADEDRSISPYRCDGLAGGLIREQCRSCHAVPDQLPIVPHGP